MSDLVDGNVASASSASDGVVPDELLRLYGSRTAGQTDFCDTELEGAEQLDGSLFLRVAGETANKMGWMREGEKAGQWDRFE